MTDATWKQHPGSHDYDTGTNWTGGIVPDDVATFGLSTIRTLTFSTDTNAGDWLFTAQAGHYTFKLGAALGFNGNGITTKGASSLTIVDSGALDFANSSTAGKAHISGAGALNFDDSSTAGLASVTVTNVVNFNGQSSAGKATINGTASFFDESLGGSARITSNDAVAFGDETNAQNAVITLVNTGILGFFGNSTAGDAKLIAKDQSFVDFSDSSGLAAEGKVSAGSIQGSGSFYLGGDELTLTSNRSTKVAGLITDGSTVGAGGEGASLVKQGTGTLTLSHADNAYTGGTTLAGGRLTVAALGAAGTGAIKFATDDTSHETLKIQNAALSDHTFGNDIDSWGIGDIIDLSGLKHTAKAHATVTPSGNGAVISVTSGGVTDTFTLTNIDPETLDFKIKNDAHGGTELVRTAPTDLEKLIADHAPVSSSLTSADEASLDSVHSGSHLASGLLGDF